MTWFDDIPPNHKWHISINIGAVIKLIRIIMGKEKFRWPWQKVEDVKITKILSDYDLMLQLRELWPNLKLYTDIRVSDESYYVPTMERLDEVIVAARRVIDSIGNEYLPEIYDCDDFALLLNAVVKAVWVRFAKENNIPKEDWKSLAFAEVWGTQFRGRIMAHAINCCLTRDDGVILIEPQGYSTWVANNSLDSVFFIKL